MIHQHSMTRSQWVSQVSKTALFPLSLTYRYTHSQKKRAYREEGYLSTAERTSLLSIFPPSPDARSNAPAFDIFLSLSKEWLTRILGDLKQSKKNVEISRSIIINQTKNRCIQFKEIPERKKKIENPRIITHTEKARSAQLWEREFGEEKEV